MANKTQDECRMEWEISRQEFLDKINQIDNETPFSDTEPKWWLGMAEVRRQIYISITGEPR